MRDIALRPYGMLSLSEMGAAGAAASGVNPFVFDLNSITFTAGMAKRTSAGPFETAPIYQGDWDGAGTPDVVTFPRGDLIGNPTYVQYANLDIYQASVVFWITPEWDGNDGLNHEILASPPIRKRSNNTINLNIGAGWTAAVDVSAWTAGTTYFVSFRWDNDNALDGTNYVCTSVNDVHTFGTTAAWAAAAPAAAIGIGSAGASNPAQAIIEGLTIYRRVLFDGTYGKDVGNGDELLAIYAAGAGVDPCTITGSNDVVACQPTDSTAGAYASGDGEMWSHPLASSVVRDWYMGEGRMPGGDWAVGYNGTTTEIDCGSDVDIDDIQDAEFTAEIWIRPDSLGESDSGRFIDKSNAANAGWYFAFDGANNRVIARVYCATTNATSRTANGSLVPDGKWHHVVMYFNDAGDRNIYIAIDGIWEAAYTTQDAGVGAISTDVAEDLIIGNAFNGALTFDGAIAWAAISNNDRHTQGTDFQEALPIVFPADDANYLASWAMEEGTGGAVANTGNQGGAGSGAANRDGTATNHTWESIWNRELTPVEPVALECDGAATEIDFGSGVNIDDLPDSVGTAGLITVDIWFRADLQGTLQYLAYKGDGNTNGWRITLEAANQIQVRFVCATTDAISRIAFVPDGVWHNLRAVYDDAGATWGVRNARMFLDGIERAYDTQNTSVGLYQVDAVRTLYVASAGGVAYLDGAVGWIRISNSIRGFADFVPDDMVDPPGNDGNAQLLINMDDGTGLTATDTSGNVYNGTITLGAGQWLNTTDGEEIEPGNRMFPHSMLIGSDAADDGIVIGTAPTNPSDSVMLPRISYGQDGRAWPIVDFAGTEFKLPRMHDTHDGAGNSATLINSDGAFTQQLIDWELYNITDGSSTTITAVSGDGTTITGVLAGGTDDDWDAADEYIIRPPSNGNYCDFPIATFAIWVLRTALAAVDLKVKNEAGEGMLQIHQMEVQESLIANGDHEAMAGNPAILTGWTNDGLDAGDTEAEAVIIHSGAQSLEWNPGATIGETQYETITTTIGKFFSIGGWTYGDGIDGHRVGTLGPGRGLLQYSLTDNNFLTVVGAFWSPFAAVWRARHANPRPTMSADSIAGDGFTDDFYAVEMDDITLTVTPASEANSGEGTGIRIDGLDRAVQTPTVGLLTAGLGEIIWVWVPRHDDATALNFGNTTPRIMYLEGAGADYIEVYWSAANTITLRFSVGAAVSLGNWATGGAGFTVGVAHHMRIFYWPLGMTLYVDTVARITVAAAISFVNIPNLANWGHDGADVSQVDAVFQAP